MTISATTSQTNCSVTVGWTNPGGSTATLNRVYYRNSGSGSMVLVKDNITAVIGSAQSVEIMEPLAFGQAYDFTVTALNATTESVLSASATSVAISPQFHFPDGFVAMLSIAGNGVAQHVGLFLVSPPRITRNQDSASELFFGDTAPRYRYGLANYRTIELDISNTFTAMQTLDTIITAAYAGTTIVYRDSGDGVSAGSVIYCGFQGQRPGTWDRYRDDKLILTETQFVYAP